MRPAQRSSRPDRTVAAVVALAVLLGGMPLTLGIVVYSSEAMFTLDVCHPVQSFGHSPAPVAAIIPGSPAIARRLAEYGPCLLPGSTLRVRAADAPDPPPPKARA